MGAVVQFAVHLPITWSVSSNIYIYFFFFHGGAGTRFKFIINSIVFAYLMRVKSADSGKKRANFPGGA